MGLLEKLKSLFGAGDGEQPPASSTDTNVTVEREPSAESEHAVKGTDEADAFGTDEEPTESGTAEPADEPEPTAAESEEDEVQAEESEDEEEEQTDEESEAEPGAPLQDIDGIGPTYADRLMEAGYETIADLKGADAAAVAEAAEAPESRVEDWLAQADDY